MHDRTMNAPLIDSQVHAYERDHPGRPWIGTLHGPPEVTGANMVEAMDAVGVDGALLVSPWSMYRFDASYALEVHASHPGRFGLIKPFDSRQGDVAEQIEEWAAKPGVVGARIMLQQTAAADDPGLHRILVAGADTGLPVNILAWGQLPLVDELARRHPQTQIVLDHVGLKQPFEPPAPPDPFSDLASVLPLARYDNVVIKISGMCTLSQQPFPYRDLCQPLSHIIEAFGIDRCLWGTDWTRAVALLTYEQGVEAFRVMDQLSDAERSLLMGGNVARIYDWTPVVPQGR